MSTYRAVKKMATDSIPLCQENQRTSKGVQMTPKSISRDKLIAHLKETIVPAKDTDNDYRFIYVIGRNMLAENMLAKIICGEFDEE
jgi:hypothetical protein